MKDQLIHNSLLENKIKSLKKINKFQLKNVKKINREEHKASMREISHLEQMIEHERNKYRINKAE